MPISTSSQSSPLPTLDESICEIIVNFRIPSINLSPAEFVSPSILNRPSQLLITDLDDDEYTATHHITCLLSEVSGCLAEVRMMFVTDIKVVSRGYCSDPRSKEEDTSDASTGERVVNVPAMQTNSDQQREGNTHVDAEEETQPQLDQGRNADDHRPWRPLSRAALQSILRSIQQKQSHEAQRSKYTDFDHDDSDDIVLDYEQDGNNVRQELIVGSNKRKALPFGSGILEAMQAGAKRSRAT